MLTIEVNPIVLFKLKQSFPKAMSASKALEKYRLLFENELNKSVIHGRSNYETLFDLYSLNLRQLSQKGPQIGPDKRRLHAWLAENGLSFYDVASLGNNLTGLLSQVKLNSMITVIDGSVSIGNQIRDAQTYDEIDAILIGDVDRNREVFANLYPDYYIFQSEEQRSVVFDVVPIDVNSLKAYIAWLNRTASKLKANTIAERTKAAVEILCVALHTNGYFLQRKKPSKFGRMYYVGVSAQSVTKDLRAAMLGDSWELDLRSSVIAFKLGFAEICAQTKHPEIEARYLFSASRWYVTDRKSFVAILLGSVFGKECDLSYDMQCELVKEALTAISFGARANVVGWKLKDGTWKNPALKDILKNPEWHKNFINAIEIKDFIFEQQMLDEFFYEQIALTEPSILEKPFLFSGNKCSRSKLVAYIYQSQETEMMNFVREELNRIRNPVLASIHDAVVVKNKLINGRLADINFLLREKFGNEFLLLRQKKIDGYKFQGINLKIESDYDYDYDYDYEFPSITELLKKISNSFHTCTNYVKGSRYV